MSKHDKNKLSIPALNNKVRAREIIDAFKSFMAHRATEYYAVLPYMNYVADSYNAEDGTYIETPDKAQKYNTVDPCLHVHTTYGQQSESLYREILKYIGQTELAKITSTFKYGLNKQKTARTSVDDGVTAFRNLLSKHGKNDANTITDLEDRFSSAPHDFTFGSPAQKVNACIDIDIVDSVVVVITVYSIRL